ncbi:histone deacetylase family protein [Mesohalobacter halotolerans]|uniref:Histone deacetylase n=1 Tax=Mesohalobacter halotolerans TaxID=1883405 RepID=A0A4U5TNL9_9FLAO|nr:histone deacetylase [Mesohalobacter halotolerans]MBS3737603.1 histone deacetylase [Psychroflexus sp.]TKS55433.1 histone deacetylase [Mesohalobacter halotolerans]
MLKIAFDNIYKHPLPEGHRFPMEKYDLLPKQLLYEGTCEGENFFKPIINPENEDYILLAHDKLYVEQLYACQIERRKARKIGFPLSPELVKRERIITNGTILACDFALQNGIAMNIAGGTHHAYRNRGEAFCMLNDQAIGAHYLLKNKLANSILIVDLDVHQGNGTAEIFDGDNRVFTFSMHGKNNYPFQKEASDLDIALDDHTSDRQYLETLQLHLPQLIDKVKPDFVFFLSGVDIVKTDKLGKLGCSVRGCKERDRYVLETCFEKGIPLEVSMGGGYSKDIKIIIEAHANTFRLAQDIFF